MKEETVMLMLSSSYLSKILVIYWSLFLPSSIISVGLVEGRLNLQEALLKGRVKVQGNADAALKFSPEMLPRIPKL